MSNTRGNLVGVGGYVVIRRGTFRVVMSTREEGKLEFRFYPRAALGVIPAEVTYIIRTYLYLLVEDVIGHTPELLTTVSRAVRVNCYIVTSPNSSVSNKKREQRPPPPPPPHSIPLPHMFSSHPPPGESAVAARRKTRPISRPNSRNRNERAGSNSSIGRAAREGSIISQRGTSGLDKELRPSPLTVTRGDGWKDTDGGIVDWVSSNHLHPSSGRHH